MASWMIVPSRSSTSGTGSIFRPRTNSKRRRTESGYVQDESNVEQPQMQKQQASQNQNKKGGKPKPKPIIGTSDSTTNGRKMRTPPADIFVWGVHPSTSIDDIVNDLGTSGIQISASDIEKKSNPEAKLCSYRISVPATLLEKALEPSIWPLRVKVREYIHYSNRARQSQNNEGSGNNTVASDRSNGVSGASSDL